MSAWANRTGCVALYAARIRFLAKNVQQAQEFGATPGQDDFPWETDFQKQAAEVYQNTLPEHYLERLSAVFLGCSLTMDEQSVPGALAPDWQIVQRYFEAASQAIADRIGIEDLDPKWEDPSDQEPTTPGVVYFDRLATFTSAAGLTRLIEAATNVHGHLTTARQVSEQHLALLQDLAAGRRIVDIATDQGWSERQLYRELNVLWDELGVANRQQGIALAAENGWLN
jgi:hypothetical protein